MQTLETQHHPEWKHAAEVIVERVEAEGFGIIITHEELDELLAVPAVEVQLDPGTKKKYHEVKSKKNHDFTRMQRISALTNYLLHEHSICIMNVRSVGYEVKDPNIQIYEATKYHMDKSRKQAAKAVDCLVNVRQDLLTQDNRDTRIRALIYANFITNSFRMGSLTKGVRGRRVETDDQD